MDAIDHFFSQYPTFNYNREASSPQEFYRLCNDFNWRKNKNKKYPPERNEAYEAFRCAMVENFNDAFGGDVNDKIGWEHMCVLLGMDPIPQGLKNMKKKIKETHVNLADLLDSHRSGTAVTVFQTRDELAAYTIEEGRYFPKEEAYAGGVLKFLLREIHNPYRGKHRSSKRRGKATAAVQAFDGANPVDRN